MKPIEIEEKFKQELGNFHDERELEQLLRIIWEDLFGSKGLPGRTLHTKEIKVFNDTIEKLKDHTPIQYVTGVSHFYNLKLKVDDSVLIPRPETEELVYHFLINEQEKNQASVLDIGTGSGCIPIAIKSKRPDFNVTAIDISKSALRVAQINAEKYELNISFQQRDILDENTWDSLPLYTDIISNPPYIPRSEESKMSESTLKYEPAIALFPDGEDELIFYKRIAEFSELHLQNNGKVYLECNEFNAKEVKTIFQNKSFSKVDLVKDLQQKDRFVVAIK